LHADGTSKALKRFNWSGERIDPFLAHSTEREIAQIMKNGVEQFVNVSLCLLE
jgi:hypothetical protein